MLHFLSVCLNRREKERERENGRGMFLQRVSRMSHERVTRDLWKLENRARSWSIGIRFRLGYIHFSFFPIFPSFFYDFLEEESEPRKGSINSSRSNVAIFRFIETTHSPFKKRFTYAPMGCSRHQVARGKYQLRVIRREIYVLYVYIYSLHSCTLDRVLRNNVHISAILAHFPGILD